MTMPVTKPKGFCKMLHALLMLALQSVPRKSNKHCMNTFTAGEVPSLRCSAIAISSPGKKQELLAALQTAYVQWLLSDFASRCLETLLRQQYLISHKHRNWYLHKYNKATLSRPCPPQFPTNTATVILKQISMSVLHEE